jgi:hypothetical protein
MPAHAGMDRRNEKPGANWHPGNPEANLAEATGFEPAVSALTGLHVRPLHHASSGRLAYHFRHRPVKQNAPPTRLNDSGFGQLGQ